MVGATLNGRRLLRRRKMIRGGTKVFGTRMRAKRPPGMFIAAISMLVVLSASLSWGRQVYVLQVGAFKTKAEADALKLTIGTAASPVIISYENDLTAYPFKVCAGSFDSYAAAWVRKASATASWCSDAFIRQKDVPEAQIANARFAVPTPFNAAGIVTGDNADAFWDAAGFRASSAPADLVGRDPATLNKADLLRLGMAAPVAGGQAVSALDRFVTNNPLDASAPRAKLTLARMLGRGSNTVRANALLAEVALTGSPAEKVMAEFLHGHVALNTGNRDAAYRSFRNVANRTDVPSGLRLESMRRAADTLHATQRYSECWLAYEQIIANVPDSAKVAEARMQLAGLQFELVGRGKGSWSEVRASLDKIIADPATPRAVRATASLMRFETLYEEGNFNTALDDCQVFLSQYNDLPREFYMARVWNGILLYRLNLLDEARQVLSTVAATQVPGDAKFAHVEPQARAAIWLAWIAQQKGNTPERDQWVNMLNTSFPGSEEAIHAKAVLN